MLVLCLDADLVIGGSQIDATEYARLPQFVD